MAKVYISSTVLDLEAERTEVMNWLVAAGHQPVHSYRPNSETVRDSCLEDVDGCDLYILILGHRYGFQIEENNPEKLSITHLEFRRAKESGIPRIALLRMSVPNIRLTDLLDSDKSKLVTAFDAEVRRELRPAEFNDMKGLIQGLSTGVQSELERLAPKRLVISQDDPRVFEVVATLTRLIDERETENVTLQGRVKELEEQLRSAVARTLTAAAQPDAGKAEIAAANALEAGDPRPAEALLSRKEQAQAEHIGAAGEDDVTRRREAAALARAQGALAMGDNIAAALAAFERAAEYEPDDAWTQFSIGDLQLLRGNWEGAMQSFRSGTATVEARLEANPDDPGAQRDLSMSHNRIGDVLLAQDDPTAALKEYQKALDIRKALAASDPANTKWQRDLSVSHEKIGDVLMAQGDGSGALPAYRKSLEIAEALAALDSGNTERQRDLSVSHEKIGDVLVEQDDGPAALQEYRKSLEIRKTLAALDPANTQWQRDFSVSHNKVGDVLLTQGDEAGALKAYRTGLEIAEALAARDSANTDWLTDVAFSSSKLGTLTGQTKNARRKFLQRGRKILVELKEQGRLLPSKDWIGWFDDEIKKLN